MIKQISISTNPPKQTNTTTFYVPINQASQILQILRSDYFHTVHLDLRTSSDLKFIPKLLRLLTPQAVIYALTNQQPALINAMKLLGLHLQTTQKDTLAFSKQPSQTQNRQNVPEKLAIGFQTQIEQDEIIDEEELLKNQNLDLKINSSAKGCIDKPRACANCNCGRKDNNEKLPSTAQLVEHVNEGKPVSGCGKCYMGDSFRCGSCPFRGLPAFKPGDKLRMVEEGGVEVETNNVVVNQGKVKIEL